LLRDSNREQLFPIFRLLNSSSSYSIVAKLSLRERFIRKQVFADLRPLFLIKKNIRKHPFLPFADIFLMIKIHLQIDFFLFAD